ncbi:MAG: aminocarboxymuconate-semialdehyde decarboxylase [Solirubrobacteraceae bacterium]|jgi:aminocarboxymuconate-semialdehyde decarboxylase|nr:aminocarboxymuconate-semialdehyde decarboxylase [Solirubrobacteraceae bacterium]
MPGVIDVHSHFLPGALVDALAARTELPRISDGAQGRVIEYGEGNVHPLLPAMGDIDRRLRDMDAQGIDMAVLGVNVPGVDWFPVADGASVARAVNDELADLVAAHPDRLAAMAALPMQDPEAAATELERAVGNGFRGAMIYSNAAGKALDEPELRIVFDTAAALDAPVYLHPTFPLVAKSVDAYAFIPTLGFLVDTTMATLRLVFDGLYERHPEFRLVLAHAASLIPQLVGRIDYEGERFEGGYGALTVKPSEALKLLYTDTVCVWPPALRSTLELLGPERIMFGSDYPFWDPARTFDTLAESSFFDGALDAVQSENARRVFGI